MSDSASPPGQDLGGAFQAGGPEPVSSHQQALKYFLALYPLMVSFGMGGSVLSVVWWGWDYIRDKFWRSIMCSVQIKYDDDTFKWVNKFMQDSGYIKQEGTLRVRVKRNDEPWWIAIFKTKDEQEKPELEYLAGPGQHLIPFKGRRIWASHHEGATLITGWDRRPTKPETITLYAYGTDPGILKEFIDAAVVHSIKKDDGRITIWEQHRWGLGWTKAQSKKPRPSESVVLDRNIADGLIKDIKSFQSSAQWYIDKGVPYRRGYLLYGPPGTGKTSFTQAVAGLLGLGICYLNLSGNNMDDDDLNRALNDAPGNVIILLEDIDALFVQRESVSRDNDMRISFSGLLNALDGVRSQEGRILFMTTNHKEKLDPALMRPGRADYHVELNNATYQQITRLFLRFNPGKEEMAEEFAKQLPEKKLSMAKLQGHFLKYRDDPEKQLENVKDVLEDTVSVDEMPIVEWLRRLSLDHYAPNFIRHRIFFVSDLRHFNDEKCFYETFGMTEAIDVKRLVGMMQSEDKLIKQDFGLLTVNQARQIIRKFVPNKVLLEKLVDCVEDQALSGFQLKDILCQQQKFDAIKEAIEKRIEEGKAIDNTKAMSIFLLPEHEEKKGETEEEAKKRIGFPAYDIEQLLKECDCEESIPKLAEHDIDAEIFWGLADGDFEKLLEVKVFGTRKKLMMRIDEIKQEHKEAADKKHEEEKKIDKGEVQRLLKMASMRPDK